MNTWCILRPLHHRQNTMHIVSLGASIIMSFDTDLRIEDSGEFKCEIYHDGSSLKVKTFVLNVLGRYFLCAFCKLCSMGDCCACVRACVRACVCLP